MRCQSDEATRVVAKFMSLLNEHLYFQITIIKHYMHVFSYPCGNLVLLSFAVDTVCFSERGS